MKTIDDEKELEKEKVNFEKNNIAQNITQIINNIPNASPIEKIRYLYINLGKLFSYDYRVAYDPTYVDNKTIDFNNYIGQYQTCIQIAYILNHYFNQIEGIESRIIKRKLDNFRGGYGKDHVANEVTAKIDDNYSETYLLDLTLDLYFIQNNCKTRHFGFESSPEKLYDIIPQMDNEEIDKKLNLINNKYTDTYITNLKDIFNKFDSIEKNEENRILFKLDKINLLLNKTNGYHEGKQFLNYLINQLLKVEYKEYNLFLKNENQITNLKTFYKIQSKNYSIWIVYTSENGIMIIDKNIISKMLENGWETKSNSLYEEFDSKKIN